MLGFEAQFIKTDGGAGKAQTIYFETDRQDARADATPQFVAADGVYRLPQLPGSGQIRSIAWKASTDADFRAQWTALTDRAATLSPDELRAAFTDLLLKWAGVDAIDPFARGQYADARHLAFVEKFFGTTYQEIYANAPSMTSPSMEAFGNRIESSFQQIADVLLTAFLSQTVASTVIRGGDIVGALSSPYFVYSLLKLSPDSPDGGTSGMQASVVKAAQLIAGLMPETTGAGAAYLVKALSGLNGMVSIAFGGDRSAYAGSVATALDQIADANLRQIATAVVDGVAALGSSHADGLVKLDGDNVFVEGRGGDVVISGVGSDLFVYSSGDGNDYIRDMRRSRSDNAANL